GQQGFGSSGGEPKYDGVATPDQLNAALGAEGGSGSGGGTETPFTPQSTEEGIEQFESQVSDNTETLIDGAISTTGEQEEQTFNEPPPEVTVEVDEEIADDNLAEQIAEEQTQLLDGLTFSGDWTAIAGLTNGLFLDPASGLEFQMEYSLTDEQGTVIVQLPDLDDLPNANVETLDGRLIRGDKFIVIGDEELNLIGDDSLATLLGGDATESVIFITQSDDAGGTIFISYEGSELPNVDFVDGQISTTRGNRTQGGPISTRANNFRNR
ncbi:MAG: hypothetical protein AAF401_11035, partial [Pseudomonadota bacterium]